jgi:peptidoglycan/LPS O-acetylase OafA/YrhL
MRNNFNLIRLVLSVMVVWSHSYPVAGLTEPTYFFMSAGMLAVHGFFTISGYLIVQSFIRSSRVLSFAWNRFLRIVPGLVAAFAVSVLAIRAFDGYAGNPLILLNASLWTLPWEMMCYLAVAAVGVAGALTVGAFPALFCAVWFIFMMHLGDDGRLFYFTVAMMMMFLMGAFAALSEKRISIPKAALAAAVVLAVIYTQSGLDLLGWLIERSNFAYGPNFPLGGIRQALYVTALPFVFIYLAVYAKPMPFIKDDVSYGVYVYAWPVQEIVVKLLRGHGIAPGGMLVFALAMPFILAVSWLSWRLIEKPALSLKKLAWFWRTEAKAEI